MSHFVIALLGIHPGAPGGAGALGAGHFAWMIAASNALIALSLFCLPIILLHMVIKRPDWAFRRVFALFSSFLIFIGFKFLIAAMPNSGAAPNYASPVVAATVDAISAILALVATIIMARISPVLIATPSRAQLKVVNEELARRADERDRAELRFRGMIEAAPDAMVVVDREGVVQLANPRAETMFARPRADLVGRTAWEALGFGRPDCILGKMELLGSGSRDASTQAKETTVRRHDGIEIPVEISVGALEDGDSRIFVCSLRDVTERRRAREELQRANDELELRVTERTAALAFANMELTAEIAERTRAETELRESEQFLESTLNSLSERIAIINDQGRILALNDAWRARHTAPDFLGAHCDVNDDYLASCEQDAMIRMRDIAHPLISGVHDVLHERRREFSIDYPYHDQSRKRWFRLKATRFEGVGGAKVVLSHEDITERKLAEEQLRHYANHDPLTGLPNRTVFMAAAQRAHAESVWNRNFHFGVLFLDLDGFKPVNDHYGHMVGDQLLLAVSRRIKSCLREGDLVSRRGGDEFTILLDGLGAPEEAAMVRDRIEREVRRPYQLGEYEINIGVSVGMTLDHERRFTNAEEIVSAADEAMYTAKRAKKAMIEQAASVPTGECA